MASSVAVIRSGELSVHRDGLKNGAAEEAMRGDVRPKMIRDSAGGEPPDMRWPRKMAIPAK